MSDINIDLVKEFFELNEFMVRVNKKHMPAKVTDKGINEIDVFVSGMKPDKDKRVEFIVTEKNIKKIKNAVVKIKGWHTESFSPAVLNSFPSIFSFVNTDVLNAASEYFRSKDFDKILVVPSLPATKAIKDKSIKILKDKGITGLLEFKTILKLLVTKVELNKYYLQSDILQTVRLFKLYDMFKGSQMELFTPRKKKRKKHQ